MSKETMQEDVNKNRPTVLEEIENEAKESAISIQIDSNLADTESIQDEQSGTTNGQEEKQNECIEASVTEGAEISISGGAGRTNSTGC